MILDRKYIGNDVYVSLDFKIYQLVFEHNYTKTNCFNNDEEAKNINIPNKFSILYDLNNTKYLMKDNFRYYIIEYPDLQLFNSWKQSVSPTEEIERSGLSVATGFYAQITEVPMSGWGGLVKTTFGEGSKRVPVTYLDGNPASSEWHYSIGMLCNAPNSYLTGGIPANEGVKTMRVSLWSAVRDSKIFFNCVKCSCIRSIYYNSVFEFMTLIFICP